MSWFSKYPNWLYSESRKLSHSSIYREKFQFIERTFISTGDILVHKNSTEYHPTLIVYPDATPYILPTVFLLNKPLDENTARSFSLLSPGEIGTQIKDNVRFFKQRHQNSEGSVCFLETGDLHGETAEIFSIDDVIKRLRIWLSGKIPKDSREVELYSHFQNKYDKIQYLLPDTFFDTSLVKGVFYATTPEIILNNLYGEIDFLKKIHIGVVLVGENSAGVALPPKVYTKKERILFAELPENIWKLIQKGESSEKVNDYLKHERLIQGYWWDIPHEPKPFSGISELAEVLGGGDKERGLDELIKALESPLKGYKEVIYVGIRFPGRIKGKEWQMFRLEKSGLPLLNPDKKALREMLLGYAVKAVQQEYFTEEYFHMRNEGRADRNTLKRNSISIIGCGALGSEIADSLTKAGVGNILFVDREEFRAHNAIRHCLGITRVGAPKVLGMAAHAVLHNPFVNIHTETKDILRAETAEYLPEGFIGVSTIADDNIESFLNETAIESNRVVFYCRALRGGKVCRIFRVIPQRDACKNCLALYKQDKTPLFVDIEEDESLPVITNECNNPVRPASAADLKIIAAITSRIVIDYLLQKNNDKNHWIWATEPLPALPMDASYFGHTVSRNIPPHPKCVICQPLERRKIALSKSAYDVMKKEAAGSGDIETGGILIGYITSGNEYIVLRATGPGPKAKRTKNLFEKDIKYCQKELEKAFRELKEKGLYLGEWHYHPRGSNSPSGTDIKSLTEIASQDNYRIEKPIMFILSPELELAITIHDKEGRCVQLPFEVKG